MGDDGEYQTGFQSKDSLAIADCPVDPLLAKKPSLDATSIGFAAHLPCTSATVVGFRLVPCCRFFAAAMGNLKAIQVWSRSREVLIWCKRGSSSVCRVEEGRQRRR